MERFFQGDDDEQDDEDGEMSHFVRASKDDIMDVMQMELVEQELNQKILEQAQRIASAEWNWFFKSTTYKLKKIQRVYIRLKKIASEEE